MMIVVLFVRGVSDHLVALIFVGEELLESNDHGDYESDLSNNEGLESEERQSTESNWDEGSGLQFQKKQNRQKRFYNLLLFATSCQNLKVETFGLVTVNNRNNQCYKSSLFLRININVEFES